jgi:hypothetical protein
MPRTSAAQRGMEQAADLDRDARMARFHHRADEDYRSTDQSHGTWRQAQLFSEEVRAGFGPLRK